MFIVRTILESVLVDLWGPDVTPRVVRDETRRFYDWGFTVRLGDH